MRWIGVFAVLCFAVVPAFGDAVCYVFDVVYGSIVVTVQDDGWTIMPLEGSFCVNIYETNGHIGSSDTFVLGCPNMPNCVDIYNSEPGEIEILGGYMTANVAAGSLRLIGFCPNEPPIPVHIGAGGEFSDSSGAHVSAYVRVNLHYPNTETEWVTTTITSEVVHISGTITTSAEASETITMNLNMVVGDIPITFTVIGITTTIYLDLEATLEGTAHASPDPALGGLIALGLGGAGTWLRRRRRG